MATDADPRTEAAPGARSGRPLTVLALMALVGASSFGLWLVLPDIRDDPQRAVEVGDRWLLPIIAVLGGASLVGPVVLLVSRRRRPHRRFRPGELMWFSQGMATWLLWPPVVYHRAQGERFGDTLSGPCYFYGTPLMAVYVTSALLVGGWLGPRRRRRRSRDWREQVGLLLALGWACTGLYLLYTIYKHDFKF
jgi:MFS family permease